MSAGRLPLLILVAASAIFIAVIAFELAPAPIDTAVAVDTRARTGTTAASPPPALRVDQLIPTILARPLFSKTRRPPEAVTVAVPAATDDGLESARLTGVLITPGRRLAIFAISGAKPLELSEGEAVSGWRIDSIAGGQVSLSGPGGNKTMLLAVDPALASRTPTEVSLPGPRAPAPAAAPAPIIIPHGPGRGIPGARPAR